MVMKARTLEKMNQKNNCIDVWSYTVSSFALLSLRSTMFIKFYCAKKLKLYLHDHFHPLSDLSSNFITDSRSKLKTGNK